MNFAVAGSAHGHIIEFIDDMLKEGTNFIGVYQDNHGIASKISEKYNVPLFDCLEELLDADIDIAGTSAVNSEKIDIIEACSRRGIHVIADKPIVTCGDGYERLKKVIDEGRIQVGMMLSLRYMPEIYTVKKLIDRGELGDIISMEILSPHRLQAKSRPDWFFDKDKNGGVAIDLIIHSIDLFDWFTGSTIVNKSGIIHKKIMPEKEGFFDSAEALVESESGVSGYFRTDWHMPDSHWTWGDVRIFCSGTKGSVEIRVLGDPITREPVIAFYKEGVGTSLLKSEDYSNSCTRDFLDRIYGRPCLVSHEDILEGSRIAIELDKSSHKIIKRWDKNED